MPPRKNPAPEAPAAPTAVEQELSQLKVEHAALEKAHGDLDRAHSALVEECTRLRNDKSNMEAEIHNLRTQLDDMSKTTSQQVRELEARSEQLERTKRSVITDELPAMYKALRPGVTDPTAEDALEKRLIETEEQREALLEEGRKSKRKWVIDPALL